MTHAGHDPVSSGEGPCAGGHGVVVLGDEGSAGLDDFIGKSGVGTRMDHAPIKSGAGNGYSLESGAYGGAVRYGVYAEGKSGDNGNRCAGEAGDYRLAHLSTVTCVFPSPNYCKKLVLRRRESSLVAQTLGCVGNILEEFGKFLWRKLFGHCDIFKLMLDIKFIRENKELIQSAAKKKRIDFDVDKLINVDEKRRKLLGIVDEKRAEQKVASNEIVRSSSEEREAILAKMKTLKEELEQEEEALKEAMKEWQLLMLQVPNVPDMSVPDGNSDADNREEKKWGALPKFSFDPKTHIEIMTELGMADFERGTKVSGFRGYFLKGSGALLSFAIWKYALDFFLARGFTFLMVPSLVRRETLLGTGYLPQGEEDLYKTQDGDFLAGTAEVAVMNFHSGEVIPKEELPKKYLAFSPCFRREAGSHSKDVKGLIRVHEFYKVEQVVLSEASHDTSVKIHEELHRNTEEFIESLGIPYRTVTNCGADLGLGQVKKYDIELWVPLEKTYREIGSTSYFHDFQTRRLNIKYKDGEETKYAHSLNSTAIPTPRILVSLIENFQQVGGSIKIPDVLIPYMNGLGEIKK